VVLVGTEDRALFETLARSFEDRARVRRVLSAADVVRELDEAGASRKLVILDAKMPTIRPTALAVLLESMRGVEVVLCRSLPETEELILSVSSASANWIIYREPAPLDRVAEACIGLVS
jgi:PleD family two-component response regulator